MAATKTREFTLPCIIQNALPLDSGDFSGLSATLITSVVKAQVWSKHIRQWILGVCVIYPPCGKRNRCLRATRLEHLKQHFPWWSKSHIDILNPSSNLYYRTSYIHTIGQCINPKEVCMACT